MVTENPGVNPPTNINNNEDKGKHELSLLKASMHQLVEENLILKEENENKYKLFGHIAHNLTTPFNAIYGFSENLIENVGDMSKEEIEESAKIIFEASQTLLKSTEKMLNWAYSQMGKIEAKISVINLNPQIKETIKILSYKAKEKEISFHNNIEDKVLISADPDLLQRVLENLCSNALKFTNPGGNITISAETKDQTVEISVVDDGKGLTEEQQKTIFDKAGISTPGTKGEKGTGFGLSFCKETIKLMHGTLAVKSEGEGKGTTFTITLPK